jgi:hypothetical protein
MLKDIVGSFIFNIFCFSPPSLRLIFTFSSLVFALADAAQLLKAKPAGRCPKPRLA